MSVTFRLGVVVAYLLLALGVGLVAYRLAERTAEDYYLASRSIGTVVLLFTTFATLMSAFTFFAGPNIAYGFGPEWILVMGLMDGVIFGLLWYFLGYKQWLVGKRHGYVTLGEMLGDRFGSTWLRAGVAVVSLFWLFPYVMLQQDGAGSALAALTEGALPFWAGAGLITAFMILYVVLAGMRGVAWTDTIQGAFMLVVVWTTLVWFLHAVGGAGAATAALADHEGGEFLALGGGFYAVPNFLSLAVGIAFGVAMFPQVNQRFFVADSERVIKRSFALWPLLVLLLLLPAFLIGSWAAGLGVAMPASENILPAVLSTYMPGWFAAVVIAGVMAAMMSSSDSMLLAGSAYFTRDLYRPLVGDVDERREDLLARVGVVAFALSTYAVSLYNNSIEGSWSLYRIGDTAFGGFAQLALPVAVALYWPRTTRTGVGAGVFGSQAFFLLTVFQPETWLGGVPLVGAALADAWAPFAGLFASAYFGGWGANVVGMALGLLLTVGVSLLTSPATAEKPAAYEVGAD